MKIERVDSENYFVLTSQSRVNLTAKEAGFYAGIMALAKDSPSIREQLEWCAFHEEEMSLKTYLMYTSIAWSGSVRHVF